MFEAAHVFLFNKIEFKFFILLFETGVRKGVKKKGI
jgi:hypothetical protein